MSFISFLDYYVPADEVSVKEILNNISPDSVPAEFDDLGGYAQFVDEVLKLQSVRVEQSLDRTGMIEIPLRRLFDGGAVAPESIDLIALIPETYASGRKNSGQYLQHLFGMSNAFVVELAGNHCVNIEVAIDLCMSIVKGNPAISRILLISATKPETVDDRVVGGYGLYGDAAGVMLIEDGESGIQLIDSSQVCFGKLHNADPSAAYTYADTLAHCKYSLTCLSKIVSAHGLTNETVDTILIHNANPTLAKHCFTSKGFDEGLIFTENLGRYGHLNQLDFLVNLKDVTDRMENTLNHNLLSFGSGWAGSYVSTLMSY